MKFAFFNDFNLGVVNDNRIFQIDSALGTIARNNPQDLLNSVIQEFGSLRSTFNEIVQSTEGIPLETVRIRAPLPKPANLLCAAVNYMEFGARKPGAQDGFIKSSNCVIGNGDTVQLPNCEASIFHHEAELGVVIGKHAKKVKQQDAMDYVFGYTNFMDISARGFAPLGPGRISFFLVKSWDTFGPMGPYLVTSDEIDNPHDLDVKLWNNGEIRHDFNTSDMAHQIPVLIEFFSNIMSLEPGDLIATGTNHQGIGAIQHNDKIVMEISGLGRLAINVEDELRRTWPRGIDQDMADRLAGREGKSL